MQKFIQSAVFGRLEASANKSEENILDNSEKISVREKNENTLKKYEE